MPDFTKSRTEERNDPISDNKNVDHGQAATDRPISGKLMVIGIFVFGLIAVGILWFYATHHRTPFEPLQRAIAEEFPDSAPKVEGGQRKIHRQTPKILRIVMRLEFDPVTDDARAVQFADRVVAFASRHHDISQYELIELHVFQLNPEEKISKRSFEFDVAGVLENAGSTSRNSR